MLNVPYYATILPVATLRVLVEQPLVILSCVFFVLQTPCQLLTYCNNSGTFSNAYEMT